MAYGTVPGKPTGSRLGGFRVESRQYVVSHPYSREFVSCVPGTVVRTVALP